MRRLTLPTTITLAIALIGAILGIVNTARDLSRDRVHIRINLGITFENPSNADNTTPCVAVEIVNLSTFPIAIRSVGVCKYKKSPKDKQNPTFCIDIGARGLPRTIPSRSNLLVPIPLQNIRVGWDMGAKYPFVNTVCGKTSYGSSNDLSKLKDIEITHVKDSQ